MKKLILASLALLLVVAAGPAMAGEPTSQSQDTAMFQALSKLSGPGQTALNVMTDKQLDAVEGQRHRRSVRINVQEAEIEQENFCVICAAVGLGGDASNQSNAAAIVQGASN